MEDQQIDWRDRLIPISKEFDDIYYAAEDGLAESRYVFLDQNKLAQRWNLQKKHKIGELGFGTGLNFLAAADLFLKTTAETKLEYISLERKAFRADDLVRALSRWPEINELVSEYLSSYDELLKNGEVSLFDGRVKLRVIWKDAVDAISDFPHDIDTWFLDGFAPKKNPEMWSPDLMSKIAEHSAENAHFSTYASAGAVRRALAEVGFKIEKQKGFGTKREMLRGNL